MKPDAAAHASSFLLEAVFVGRGKVEGAEETDTS